MSLVGLFRISALIYRAVLPGNTNPEASWSWPWTSGATPRTIELPTMLTDTGFRAGLSVRRRCGRAVPWLPWFALRGAWLVRVSEGGALTSREARAAYLLWVTTAGTAASWPEMGGFGNTMSEGSGGIRGCSLIVSINVCSSELCSLRLVSNFRFQFSED